MGEMKKAGDYEELENSAEDVVEDELDGGVLKTHRQVRDTYAEGTIDANYQDSAANDLP